MPPGNQDGQRSVLFWLNCWRSIPSVDAASFCPRPASHRIHIGTGSNRQALIVHDWVDYSIGDHRSKKQTCKRTLIAGKKCGLSSKALLLGINYDVNQKVEVVRVGCVRPRGIFSIPQVPVWKATNLVQRRCMIWGWHEKHCSFRLQRLDMLVSYQLRCINVSLNDNTHRSRWSYINEIKFLIRPMKASK